MTTGSAAGLQFTVELSHTNSLNRPMGVCGVVGALLLSDWSYFIEVVSLAHRISLFSPALPSPYSSFGTADLGFWLGQTG